MNAKRAFQLIQREWKNLDFEITKETDDGLSFQADIVAEKYFDDSILLRGTLYDSGTFHIFFVFDKLDKTFANYDMINDLNDNTSFLHGYISEKKGGDYLELKSSTVNLSSDEDAEDFFSFVLRELLSDNTLEYLTPLADETY